MLLPVTALPSRGACGDLGPASRDWLDFCSAAGCKWWQILPFGPTGYGNSPYQCFSTFAGNPLWISPEDLATEGFLEQLPAVTPGDPERIDYAVAVKEKNSVLNAAWQLFNQRNDLDLQQEFAHFREQERYWLDDFALFMVIRAEHRQIPWQQWPRELRTRETQALARIREQRDQELLQICFTQWLFARQWQRLRREATDRGIGIIGDLPIFVAADAADVWAHPELFKLDAALQLQVVAGVPPDYFSSDGQLWGNPLYEWEEHTRSNFDWWVSRVRYALQLVDLVRLDHFRGFDACWEVPVGEATARKGSWEPAPGRKLLQRLQDELSELPLIAEDLGLITPTVKQLREDFHLPGMAILQFAFDTDYSNIFLPHNLQHHSVAYTGTHDNDTTRGWWQNSSRPQERRHALQYLHSNPARIVRDLVRVLLASVPALTIIPLQDLLQQDSTARINYPGRPEGNWEYRCLDDHLTSKLAEELYSLNQLYGRLAESKG